MSIAVQDPASPPSLCTLESQTAANVQLIQTVVGQQGVVQFPSALGGRGAVVVEVKKQQQKRHRRTASELSKDFMCFCGRSYCSEGALKSHIKLKHPDAKRKKRLSVAKPPIPGVPYYARSPPLGGEMVMEPRGAFSFTSPKTSVYVLPALASTTTNRKTAGESTSTSTSTSSPTAAPSPPTTLVPASTSTSTSTVKSEPSIKIKQEPQSPPQSPPQTPLEHKPPASLLSTESLATYEHPSAEPQLPTTPTLKPIARIPVSYPPITGKPYHPRPSPFVAFASKASIRLPISSLSSFIAAAAPTPTVSASHQVALLPAPALAPTRPAKRPYRKRTEPSAPKKTTQPRKKRRIEEKVPSSPQSPQSPSTPPESTLEIDEYDDDQELSSPPKKNKLSTKPVSDRNVQYLSQLKQHLFKSRDEEEDDEDNNEANHNNNSKHFKKEWIDRYKTTDDAAADDDSATDTDTE